MRTATMRAIYEAAKRDESIYFLTGDYGKAFMDMFREDIPDQVMNLGMAEQNLIGVAAGLALSGKKVFVYSIVPFVTLRCLEQLKVDVCYHNLDVTVVGVGGGFVYGSCGVTHLSIEDIAVMRSLPNMKIVAPANPMEATLLTNEIIRVGGPAYIRLNKANELDPPTRYPVIFGRPFVAKSGTDVTVVSTGAMLETALKVAQKLELKGLSTEVLHMHTLKPFNADSIKTRANHRECIITIEEHSIIGGLGSCVAEAFAEAAPNKAVFKRFGIKDVWPHVVGTQQFLRDHAGLSPEAIVAEVFNLMCL